MNEFEKKLEAVSPENGLAAENSISNILNFNRLSFEFFQTLQGVQQKSISIFKCPYSKMHEINSNKIFTVVKIFHCLHLEVFID